MSNDYSANASNPPETATVTPEASSAAVNIKALKAGTVLLIEGETDIYELIVRYPEYGIVDVSSNARVLRAGVVGQFLHSVCWSQPGTKLNVIQRGWAMVFLFSNGTYQSQPVSSLGISGVGEDGKRWHYDVF
jgi:hypothetical protein